MVRWGKAWIIIGSVVGSFVHGERAWAAPISSAAEERANVDIARIFRGYVANHGLACVLSSVSVSGATMVRMLRRKSMA